MKRTIRRCSIGERSLDFLLGVKLALPCHFRLGALQCREYNKQFVIS